MKSTGSDLRLSTYPVNWNENVPDESSSIQFSEGEDSWMPVNSTIDESEESVSSSEEDGTTESNKHDIYLCGNPGECYPFKLYMKIYLSVNNLSVCVSG